MSWDARSKLMFKFRGLEDNRPDTQNGDTATGTGVAAST